MILGIDPKVDYAFKHLLGRESTRSVLIDVIDKVLNPPPGRHIDDIELLNPFKFKKSLAESTSGLDFWLYFLRHAAKMDTEAVPAVLLQQPQIMRALEELKMLSQSDVERERYEARRKAQLDYNTGMKVARMEGRAEGQLEGLVRGEKIGMIHLCERLLNRPQTPTEQLACLSVEELTRLADGLQAQMDKR